MGYKSGTSLGAATSSSLSATAPTFTNFSVDQYLVVVNEDCDEVLEDAQTQTSNGVVVRMEDLANNIGDVIASSTKWFFYNDETDVIDNALGSFVSGPSIAPLGTGSAQMGVTGTQRRNIATYRFAGMELSDIEGLTFSTYAQSAGDGALGLAERAPYLNFNIDFTGGNVWQSRLVYVPAVNGVVTADTWQSWNATSTAMWTWSRFAKGPDNNAGTLGDNNTWPDGNTNEYRTWSDIRAAFPNAKVLASDGWFGFRVGEPYADGFTGNVDNFAITIDDGSNATTTTFDFEPTALVVDEDDDEGGSEVTTTSGSGPENGSPSFSSFGVGGDSGGSVLGASTSNFGTQCETYLTGFIKPGGNNDPEQVRRLQYVLSALEGLDVPLNGIYDAKTIAGVHAFQTKYASEILAPWGVAKSTGFVYLTTRKKVNEIFCKGEESFPLTAAEQRIIDTTKARNEQGGVTNNGNTPASKKDGASSDDTEGLVGQGDDSSSQTASVGSTEPAQDFWGMIKSFFGF